MRGSLRVRPRGWAGKWLLGTRGVPGGSLCVFACLRAFEFVVPAARAGLWPQGFVCPAASNWAPGAATGTPACISPAVGASTLYIHIYAYSH